MTYETQPNIGNNMKLNAYTIYDVAAGTYSRPYYTGSDGEATRAFKDIATDAEHPIGAHPEDYTLYRTGSFNDSTGKMEGEQLEKLTTGLQCVHQDRNPDQAQLKLATEN